MRLYDEFKIKTCLRKIKENTWPSLNTIQAQYKENSAPKQFKVKENKFEKDTT